MWEGEMKLELTLLNFCFIGIYFHGQNPRVCLVKQFTFIFHNFSNKYGIFGQFDRKIYSVQNWTLLMLQNTFYINVNYILKPFLEHSTYQLKSQNCHHNLKT